VGQRGPNWDTAAARCRTHLGQGRIGVPEILSAHAPGTVALTAGYQSALLVSTIFVLEAAFIALRSNDTRETAESPAVPANPATDAASQ
jgi:hypothetical protein